MSLNVLIDQYFLTVTNLSPRTIKLRKTLISVFAQFVNFKREIDQNDVIAFFNSDRFKQLNESSKNLYRVHLKMFFDYLNLKLDEVLFKKNKIIKKELQKSELLTKTEIRSVLKKMSKPWEKAYFILLYETKARRNEILYLKIKDVVFYDSYAMVYIRSSKSAQRNIPIVESIPYLT
ncbi:MAG TPA: tyrosine-type recombinase/integrase, partial [Candidatus Lokiarchaeia archaeon]